LRAELRGQGSQPPRLRGNLRRGIHLALPRDLRLDIQAAYKRTEALIDDDAQRCVVTRLAELQQELASAGDRRSGWLGRLWPSTVTPVRGVYLWGPVGRGKTFLMDLFFETLATRQKRRIHFHRMMSDVHRRLRELPDVENPVDKVAAAIARDIRVLCFDEFFVNDIGDAMILARLLDGLFRRGVTLVATSNSPPTDLYRDGLQRERFVSAIRLLETHTRVVQLDGGPDYRLRVLEQAGTVFSAGEDDVDSRLADYFCRIAPGEFHQGRKLDILGRSITTVREARGVAWFEFSELCEGPRSQEDYIEIARCYQTVIVSGIPVMGRNDENAARRFIALVDEFYDRRVKLIISAHAEPDSLYQGLRLRFEFERTQSRLTEMRTQAYLSAAHLP
jgi:cell division protein ZapE